MRKFISWKLLTIIVVALAMGFFDLPTTTQQKLLPFVPEDMIASKVKLGLDLQGGSQLDYKIDLRKVPELDREGIIDGVQEVIEKRVNRLGVAEPNIYRSEIAGENHIIVELAETGTLDQTDVDQYLGEKKLLADLSDDEKKLVSLEKAKAAVGKTIQLEFKEKKQSVDPQEEEKIRNLAQQTIDRIKNGEDYAVVGQEEAQAAPGKVKFEKSDYSFSSDLPESIRTAISGLAPGAYKTELVETGGTFVIDETGQAVEEKGLSILRLVDKKEEIKNEKEVDTSHILIAWTGLDSADATVTRSEDEAYKLAKEIKGKLDDGVSFKDLAKEYSNDTSNKDNGGILEKPVTGDGSYVFDFEEAALALEKEGDLSDIIKTQFGYHIIKADGVFTDVKETQYQYEEITFSLLPDPWQDTGLTGEHFVHADVQLDNLFQPYVSIQFNDEGARLFEEITGRNVQKPLAIFVGGELISAPNVNEKISGGTAQISGQFTNEEAKTLARDLNTGAIPAPIVLTGEYTIGATLGQEALSKSLFAGTIGLIVVMLFMIAYYRLPGLMAAIALLIYSIILIFLIKAELPLGASLAIALIVFGFLVTKIINNQDSGWEKFLSFILSCFGFFFVTFLLRTGVVMTLAGIAGIVMSIGMAVDANVLIFERIKEEIREGKSLDSAINIGFHRAWSAIRDSNFSTLLTCAILFYFGSSIIRGFAFNLAAGILVSMFTAITITRAFMNSVAGRKIASNMKIMGIDERKSDTKPIKFIAKSKLWFTISGTMVGISILAIAIFGLNLGIDFKGGTLMEFKFNEAVTQETLTSTLEKIAAEEGKTPTPTATTTDEPTLSEEDKGTLDLSGLQVLASGENSYIIKTKYISSETHDRMLVSMKETLPAFTELRFTTIGPVIGSTLMHKAIIAMIFAIIMIVIYVALAFRKIPKEVSSWRFGASAIVALVHDIVITTGVFVILGLFLDIEINALFVTAMLTVFGYSVNDTIVVLDRMRENLIHGNGDSLAELADRSLSQTLARSINTSLSTILALVAVLIFGSPAIFYFVLALTVGIGIGTYSSIFLAAPLLVWWHNKKQV